MEIIVSRATPSSLRIVYVIMHGKIKCPTLGPASSVKTPWYPLVLRGRGIVGHTIDRCITGASEGIGWGYALEEGVNSDKFIL